MQIDMKDIVAAIVALDRADRFISRSVTTVEGSQTASACFDATLALKRAIAFGKIEIKEQNHVAA